MNRRDFIFYSIGTIGAGAFMHFEPSNIRVKTILSSQNVSLNYLKTSVFNSGDKNQLCYSTYKNRLDQLVDRGQLLSREILEVNDSRLVFQDVWQSKINFESYFQSSELDQLIEILKSAGITVEHQIVT